MGLLFLGVPVAAWYLAKDCFPRLSKLCGFLFIFEIFIGLAIAISTH